MWTAIPSTKTIAVEQATTTTKNFQAHILRRYSKESKWNTGMVYRQQLASSQGTWGQPLNRDLQHRDLKMSNLEASRHHQQYWRKLYDMLRKLNILNILPSLKRTSIILTMLVFVCLTLKWDLIQCPAIPTFPRISNHFNCTSKLLSGQSRQSKQ